MTTLEIKRQESKNIYQAIKKLMREERLSLTAIAARLDLPEARVKRLYKRHRRAEIALMGLEKILAEENKPKIPGEYLKYLP